MVISNHNGFRVLFDKLLPYISFEKYINILALELREPALCQLYRHTFVPYSSTANLALALRRQIIYRINSTQLREFFYFHRERPLVTGGVAVLNSLTLSSEIFRDRRM